MRLRSYGANTVTFIMQKRNKLTNPTTCGLGLAVLTKNGSWLALIGAGPTICFGGSIPFGSSNAYIQSASSKP